MNTAYVLLRPGYAEAYNNLGVLYYNKGMYEEAVAAFAHLIAVVNPSAKLICPIHHNFVPGLRNLLNAFAVP